MAESVVFFKAPRYVLRKLNILRLLRDRPDIKTFLDVGCGAGELAVSLAEQGKRGTALDFSPAAIATTKTIAAQRGLKPGQLQLRVGGLEQVKGKTFDLVICCEVLEHVENDAHLLHELASHSKRYMLISVPAKQRLFDASDEAVGHFRRYEKLQLLELIAKEGLTVQAIYNYGYPFTNAVRVARKAAFVKKLRKNKTASMESKSKESGINPVKLPGSLQRLDIEPWFRLLFHISRSFNHTDLGEGYVLLCEKSAT